MLAVRTVTAQWALRAGEGTSAGVADLPSTQPSVEPAVPPETTPTLPGALFGTLAKISRIRPEYAATVTPLRHPGAAFKERLAMVRGAETSIIATSYMITADTYGLEFVEALITAAKAGKTVVLGLDWLAQTAVQKFASDFDNKRLFYKLRELRFYGGTVAWFARPLTQLGHFGAGMHLKTLLVDGNAALVGGRNVGHHYYESWGDFEVKLTGAAASAIVEPTIEVLRRGDVTCEVALSDAAATQKRYLGRLDELSFAARAQLRQARERTANELGKDTTPPGAPLLHLFVADPITEKRRFDPRPNPITQALVTLIDSAQRKIVLSSNYVNGGKIVDALLRARQRGLEVDVVTTGEDTSELSLLPYANARRTYERLAAAGVRVHETNHRMEHAKLYCFDDSIVAFGSYNVEPNADTNLVEGLWVTADATISAAVREALSSDLREQTEALQPKTKRVTPGDYVLGWFLQPFL